MAKRLQLRRGTTAQNDAFTGALGELTYDTDKKQLRVHDGSTVGGNAVDNTTRDVTSQVSNATETVAGKAKIATTAIAQEGVNDTDIITAKKLRDALNATDSAPVYACRAWVNFNGNGTVAIRGSGNVSSITDNGVGNYFVNLTTSLQDSNFAVNATTTRFAEDTYLCGANTEIESASRIRIYTGAVSALTNRVNYDTLLVSVTVFR